MIMSNEFEEVTKELFDQKPSDNLDRIALMSGGVFESSKQAISSLPDLHLIDNEIAQRPTNQDFQGLAEQEHARFRSPELPEIKAAGRAAKELEDRKVGEKLSVPTDDNSTYPATKFYSRSENTLLRADGLKQTETTAHKNASDFTGSPLSMEIGGKLPNGLEIYAKGTPGRTGDFFVKLPPSSPGGNPEIYKLEAIPTDNINGLIEKLKMINLDAKQAS